MTRIAVDPIDRFKGGGKGLEEYRQQLLDHGRSSLFFFITAICGATAPDPDTGESTLAPFHADLCAFLEGKAPHHPYRTAVVCCSRGTGKSLFVRYYGLWRALFIDSFQVLLISNSADNAKRNHFEPILNLFTNSERSEFIRWLFRERCPPGMEGTNTERLVLRNRDPNAGAAFTYAGLESKLEGKHPDLIIGDDLEGADAEKSNAMNEQAYQLYQQLIPLPRHPTRSQIILTLTPWGKRPLAWRLRDENNWKQDSDNATSPVKFFWRPAEDANGNSIWPQRYPKVFLDSIRKQPIFKSQYLLKKSDDEDGLFDEKTIDHFAWRWLDPTCETLLYKGFEFDPDEIGEDGFVRPKEQDCTVKVKQLRYFIHLDPLHRTIETRKTPAERMRPAKAAIVVVGVGPDAHSFVMETWTRDVALDKQAEQLFRLYCKWAAYKVTFEGIGAQIWLKSHIEAMEKGQMHWANPQCSSKLAPGMRLPKLSLRLEEGSKTTTSKEYEYREGLVPRINQGILHIRRDQEEMRSQLLGATDENSAVDLVDALAQGPKEWSPGLSDEAERDYAARRSFVKAFIDKGKTMAKTGFQGMGWR